MQLHKQATTRHGFDLMSSSRGRAVIPSLGTRLAGIIAAAYFLLPCTQANEQVVPLVFPSLIALQNERQDDLAPLPGPGFPEVAGQEFGSGPETGLGLDFPDPAARTDGAAPVSQALVIPLMPENGRPADDDADDPEMDHADDPDTEWQDADTSAAAESGGSLNTLATSALFGRQAGAAPTIGDTWLSGYDSFPTSSFRGGGVLSDLRHGLSFSVNLVGAYDSNPSQGFSGPENEETDDYFMLFGGEISYLSRASTWTYGIHYSGGYRQYFNQTDLSGAYHSGGASIGYSGGPLSASLGIGVDFGSGANRNFQSVTDSINYSYRLNARYSYSPKNSLAANFSQNFSTSSGGGGLDTGSFDSGLSLLWKYSPLTEFGPGVRYTRRTQENGPTRTSIGPTLSLNHELTGKISLNSRVGLDFTGFEGGGFEDTSWSTSAGLNYQASPLWSTNLSVLRDSQASFSTSGQFEDVWALRLGYNRRIWRLSWNLGVGYENRSVENATVGGDRDYFTVDTSLGMPLFGNTTSASIFVGYSDESSDGRSWNSVQLGISVSRSF